MVNLCKEKKPIGGGHMARKVVWIVVFGSAVLSLCAIAYGEDAAYFSSKNRDRSNEPRASDDRVS